MAIGRCPFVDHILGAITMMRLVRKRGTKARSLAQQQADFTSEGSPAPGKVDTKVPATTPAQASERLALPADPDRPRPHRKGD
jgi:hypothetical protein